MDRQREGEAMPQPQTTERSVIVNPDVRTERIRALNDALRRKCDGGRIVITSGVTALPEEVMLRIFGAIADFDAFDDGNDPYSEHDFGSVTDGTLTVFFKIDYYDTDLTMHSPDPADPAVTTRVLTIMLADEW